MFYIMAGDSQTPRRFRCLIKHFWDIIMKVVPKVYFLLWCQSHWPSSCVSEECSKSEHLNRHLPVLSAPIVVFRSKLSWYCFYFNKLGCINILISFLRNKNFILSAWKFKECFGLKQASDCYYKLVTKKRTTIFWWYSEANKQSWSIHWILLDVFFYIQPSFSIFLWIQKSIVKFIW